MAGLSRGTDCSDPSPSRAKSVAGSPPPSEQFVDDSPLAQARFELWVPLPGCRSCFMVAGEGGRNLQPLAAFQPMVDSIGRGIRRAPALLC
jgi:hypothetical protein